MWDQRYREPGFAYGTNPNDFLKAEYARIPKGGRILCLAEGEGRNAVFLAQQGYRVTAVDQSAVGLQKAEAWAHEQGLEIATIVADLSTLDPGIAAWDGIVSISAHLPPAIRRPLHSQVVAALKKDGILLLEAYTDRQLEMDGVGGPPASQKDLFMSLHDLEAELAGLDFVVGRELEREMSEGKYHQGLSAVVQVIARKG
ncbi:MAG: class I SAM-dependent methyltransferase [Cyanobacteria bacterium P01_F01_bin.53]